MKYHEIKFLLTIAIRLEAALLAASIIITSTACGGGSAPANTAVSNAAPAATSSTDTAQAPVEVARFSDDELDGMLARIALFPDPLLAQIIPASTFVEQLKEAQGALGGSVDDGRIDNQSWDVSVKSVAHYPPVLKMLVDDEGWTANLGQAYVLQPEDVAKSIQRLRAEARDAGNLVSGPQMNVVEAGETIRIEPAEPKMIYVPQYDPETVYVEQPAQKESGVSTGTAVAVAAIAFTTGLLIGAWLNNDYDYYGRGIYYHGWNGAGWVGVNRSYVNVNRSVYINNSYRNINVNRNVVSHHSATTYRRNLTLNSSLRKERINNARVNNPNRVNNSLPRTGKNIDRNNLDKNRVNNSLPRTNAGSRNLGGSRTGSPKINSTDRTLGGNRPNAAPNVQNRQAPSMQRQRPAPSSRTGSGGRRRP
ncbi:MAG: DUF3300 domain-containing protein [Saprospiraceae bacterium]|nr:DUF3300 domain-containing protein [Pyrinomonadaceae bacterium]